LQAAADSAHGACLGRRLGGATTLAAAARRPRPFTMSRTRWSLDGAPLLPVALGVAVACTATLVVAGAPEAPARVLAAAFVGAAAAFVGVEAHRRGVASPAVLFVIGVAY